MMSSRITFSADGHGARSRRALTLALCLVSCALVPAYAQTPAASPAKGAGDVVALPAFQVASSTDDSFIGKEAMSTTRTGVAIADLAQSVVVVNKEFLNDLRPEYIADIMKYVGGGQTGTLTWTGSTRYMMRGYTTEVISTSIKNYDRYVQFANSTDDLWNKISWLVDQGATVI